MTHTTDITPAQTYAKIIANIAAKRVPILGLGSMAVVKALAAHGNPADIAKPCESALQLRLKGYLEAGKSEKSAAVKSTTKALATFTFVPDVPGGDTATLFKAEAPDAPTKPKAPSRKTKADLQAELAELQQFVALLTCTNDSWTD